MCNYFIIHVNIFLSIWISFPNIYSPTSDLQPPDDVNCISWNHQVQHILASTYAGRCVVWDLRKNEPIIKVTDSVSRVFFSFRSTIVCAFTLADKYIVPSISLTERQPLRSKVNGWRGIPT